MTDTAWLWISFNVFVLAMLALDLGVFHRKAHVVTLKESLSWTVIWVGLAMSFNAGVWHFSGSQRALESFTGYVIVLILAASVVATLLWPKRASGRPITKTPTPAPLPEASTSPVR